MAAKPTDLPEWATDPGADVETPPTGKQASGWTPLEKPPHQWFNWLFLLIYRWLAFFQDYSTGHKHDGGTSDLSVPKIDIQTELGMGDYGEFVVTQDNSSGHRMKYAAKNGATSATLTTDNVEVGEIDAEFYVTTDFLKARTGSLVTVRDSVGGAGDLKAKQLESVLSAVGPNIPKGVVKITESGGLGSLSLGVASMTKVAVGHYEITMDAPSTSNAIAIQATASAYPAYPKDTVIVTDTKDNGDGTYSPVVYVFDGTGTAADRAVDVTIYY